MNQKTLTIAVPAYQAAPFIRRCLDSLTDSRVIEELEILVCDDGGRDETLAIAGTYADRFPDSIRLIHKENGGHGSVINLTAAQAKGKYYKVLDADDWLVTENLPVLLSYLRRAESDVVITAFDMVNESGGFRQHFKPQEMELGRDYSMAEWMALPGVARVCSTFHGIIYRTAFYQSTGVQVTEKIFYEDQEYATLPFYSAGRVSFLDLNIYQYLIGREGQSVSRTKQVQQISMIERILNNLIAFYKEHPMLPEKKEYFLYKMGVIAQSYLTAALLKNPDRHYGREDAAAFMERLAQSCPELAAGMGGQYKITRLLHTLHVSPEQFERMKRTKLYYWARKTLKHY